jgi:hypothetical protein
VLPLTLVAQLPIMTITPPVTGRLALPAVKLTEQLDGDAGGVALKFSVIFAEPPPFVGSLAATL